MIQSKFSNFYIRSGIFGILSLAGAVINYALYPVLVRVLNTSDFGDFAALVALSNQVMGILIAFNVISIYLVKSQKEERARAYAQVIQKMLIWFFVAAILILLLLSPLLSDLLKIDQAGSFLVLSIILITAVPAVVWTGYLQGHKEMVRIGVYNIASSASKFGLAVALAMVLGMNGGILGILGGAIIGLVILKVYPGVRLPQLKSLVQKSKPQDRQFVAGLRGYFLECLFVVGALSFLQNYDITLAKALFGPAEAGVYSGVSILSNALYYLSFLIVWIILPEIKIGDKKINRRILTTAYRLLAALTLAAITFELIFRDHLTQLLLGQEFANQGNLLVFASLYQLSLVAVTLYAYFLLINRKKRSAILGLLVFGTTALIPALFAQSPIDMIRLLWLSVVASFALYWLLVFVYRQLFSKAS
ncbi:MAG: hypothetical protein QG553_329 [Patescibacteria group bacterium]|nr:hypothetical protein [Patescibacteria group bacterium]